MQPEVKVKISALDSSQGAFKSLSRNIEGVEKKTKSFKGKIESLQPTFQKMTTYGGLAFGAISAGAIALSKVGAQSESVSLAFNRMTDQAGISGDTLVSELKRVSAGTVDTTSLMLASNKAMALGVGKDMKTMTTLMEIARLKGQNMGLDTTQAFNDIVTGIGRGSPLILDNLGITIKLGEAQERYAQKLGKTSAQLTDAEKKNALLNAVMSEGQRELDATGKVVATASEKFQKFNADIENLKAKMGSALLPALQAITKAVTPIIEKVAVWIEKNPKLARNIVIVSGVLAGLTLAVGALGIALNVALSPIGLIAVALAGLTAGVMFVIKAFQNLAVAVGLSTAKAKHATYDFATAVDDLAKPMGAQKVVVDDFGTAVEGVGDKAKETADKIKTLREEAEGIFGEVDKDEADSKRRLAETIVAQEEKVSDMRTELRKLQRDEDTDANAGRIRELRNTIEQEEDALRSTNSFKGQLREEVREAERRASLSDFERQVEDIQRQRVARLEAQVARLQEIQLEIEAERKKSSAISSAFGNAQVTMQNAVKKTSEIAVAEADKMKSAFDRAIASMSELNVGGSRSLNMSVSSKLKYVNDAVISPRGDIVSTHPDDWLIATKDPKGMVEGKGGGTNININISGTFLDDRTASKRLGDEIMSNLKQQMRLA